MGDVRCRIAPAPTGYLHVGNARAALYNWLFARHHGGTFVLRVEDTDRKRSTEEAIGILIHSLRWLGLDWDEGPEVGGPFGPYRQSERMADFVAVTERFLEEGRAYHCYCTPEELEDRRRAALKRGETPGYDGRCRNLTDVERATFEAEGRPRAVRFAMPGTDKTVHDLIRGDAHFPANDLRDFVIMRSDGTPTYLLAAAVDDVNMEMTHVIRGEDLLPSTPRQVEMIEAMGATPPRYAHLPLIVGPNGQPLSKRHGSVAVEHFREEGYLPEAMVNYLALLGWSYDATTTFFTLEEMIEKFDLSRVSHSPAAFDEQKLVWMNGHYIREVSDARLAGLLAEAAERDGLGDDAATLSAAVPLIKERMHTLEEGLGLIRFLFVDPVVPDEKASRMLGPERADLLREAASRLEAVDWAVEEIHRVLEEMAVDLGLSTKQAFQPIRAAVTGALVSPPLFESIHLLGRERTLERLRSAAA
ncbi:MAG TPA: glutamate--tRNA ligase [Actinomycetota bacterium]|nr:glutamate--tRNA ligase [Actinomycetota bacterium]